MSMNIDKPLEDIISTNKSQRKRLSGPRGLSRKGGKTRAPSAAANKVVVAVPVAAVPVAAVGAKAVLPVGDKIIVSNLPDDVTESQVRDLFQQTVGPVRFASLSFDSKGKSKGMATIQFSKAGDATKAYTQYNKRLIDGKRPMKVEIIVDPSRVPPPPLTSRLGAAPLVPVLAASTVAAASGAPASATRGKGRRGRGGRSRGDARPKMSAEDLDAEMTDYQNQAAAATTATA